MSTQHCSGVEALVGQLEELAERLAIRQTHFNLYRSCGQWELVVFVRPLAYHEVAIRESVELGTYGVIRAGSPDLADVLATGIRICRAAAVANNVAVPA